MPNPFAKKTHIVNSDIMVPVDIQGQYGTLNVDVMATESSSSAEVTVTASDGSQDILTPSSGKKLDTRGVYLFTDASAGEISVEFSTSGITLAKIYPSKFAASSLPDVRFQGATDEPLTLVWTGLTSGDKIFVVIRYKEV